MSDDDDLDTNDIVAIVIFSVSGIIFTAMTIWLIVMAGKHSWRSLKRMFNLGDNKKKPMLEVIIGSDAYSKFVAQAKTTIEADPSKSVMTYPYKAISPKELHRNIEEQTPKRLKEDGSIV